MTTPAASVPLIELTEHGAGRDYELAAVAATALKDAHLVTTSEIVGRAGWWRVKAAGKIGSVAVTALDGRTIRVHIAPKTPVARLLFLLGYSIDAKGWRDDDTLLDEEAGLVPVVAWLFLRQAERALCGAPLRGYRTTEGSLSVLRGRIREADQLRTHYGRAVPAEVTHDEYTVDIAENRLLRAACERLCRLPGDIPGGIPDQVRTRLLRLGRHLADVTPIGAGHRLPAWRPTRLNTRYHIALRLAELVLRETCVEHRPGEIAVNGFLLDMPKVFERFVTVALSDTLAGRGGRCELQEPLYLDEQNAIKMYPDFVRYADSGRPIAVVDAKYKVERPQGYPDADLYQILAYCVALGLPEGHLVYAKGNAAHAEHRVRHAGIVIHQHALDLDQPPVGLLAEIQALAARLDLPGRP